MARLAIEYWLSYQTDEFPYLPLDRQCHECRFTCKYRWRFAGLQGASGYWYYVAPLCPILWQFSPYNPFAVLRLIPTSEKYQHSTDRLLVKASGGFR